MTNEEVEAAVMNHPDDPPPTPPSAGGAPDYAASFLKAKMASGQDGGAAPAAAVPDYASSFLKAKKEDAIPQLDANMDARDKAAEPSFTDFKNAGIQAADREEAKPSWLKGAFMQQHPQLQRVATQAMIPFDTPNAQNEATARGLVKGAAAIPGNFENLVDNTAPMALGFKDKPTRTFFPTSEDMDKNLTHLGWKANPAYADYEQSGDLGASMLVPANEAGKGVERGLGVMGSEGKATSLTRRGVEDVKRAAQEGTDRIVGQHPMPVGPDVPPIYPKPVEVRPQGVEAPTPYSPKPAAPAAAPGAIPPGRMVPKNDVNTVLEGHLAENQARLDAGKKEAWEEYQRGVGEEAGVVNRPDAAAQRAKGVTAAQPLDAQPVLDKWQSMTGISPTQRAAVDKVMDHIKDLQSQGLSHADAVKAFHALKREVGDAGKGVADATGYSALKGNLATSMEKDINAAIKESSPAYTQFTKNYRELSEEAEPLDRSFLKGVGSDEGTVQMANALKDPKNVRSTIDAMGPGGREKFDQLAAKHVTSELSGKTGASLERAATNLTSSLRDLPQAREALETTVRNAQANEAAGALAKKLEAEHADALKAWGADSAKVDTRNQAATRTALNEQKRLEKAAGETNAAGRKAAEDVAARKNATTAEFRTNAQKAQDLANSYKPAINNLQRASTKDRPAAMKSMVNKMAADGIISDAQHDAFLVQINAAAKANNLSAKLSTLSKYIGYSLTGNYMLSFGGPHAYEFVKEKVGK